MMRPFVTMAALLALAMPASSNATGSPRWSTDPTCTATTTALTCSGKAAAVQPQTIIGLSSVEAGIKGEVHYTCADPAFESIFFGFPGLGPVEDRYLASGDFHNGRTFSVQFAPPSAPLGITAGYACFSGQWTRDPNYYNVRVVVGWGFGSATPSEALAAASVGTVSPG
jgi:hypothetical protein